MRMRRKKNLTARLEAVSDILIAQPEQCAGRWISDFMPGAGELLVELGCGLGSFTCGLSAEKPGALVAGIEKVQDALVVAAERAKKSGEANARFVAGDAGELPKWFSPGEIDGLYINFCDPWPHWKQARLRLVARGFLEKYAALISPDGALYFKTDNAPLFEFAQKELRESGWSIVQLSHDLPCGGGNIPTDYELKFRAAGVPIRFLAARPPEKGQAKAFF